MQLATFYVTCMHAHTLFTVWQLCKTSSDHVHVHVYVSNSFLYTVSVTAPTIIAAIRTDATSALIEWEPLNLEQLRGNLTSYEIVYIPLENECPPHSNTNKEETMSIQVTKPVCAITDLLDPGREYCVGIAANTGAGTGMFSYNLITCE